MRTLRLNRHRFRVRTEASIISKKRDLLLAEELPAVPAVVTPLGEGEAHRAARAAVHHLVLHPVVGGGTTRLVADGPAEDSTASVTHEDLAVVPVRGTKMGGGYKERSFSHICYWGFCSLGDGERGDLSWVSVVLAIKRSVHGEFAPEDQLALPSVPWRHPQIHTQTRRIKQLNLRVCVFCEAG